MEPKYTKILLWIPSKIIAYICWGENGSLILGYLIVFLKVHLSKVKDSCNLDNVHKYYTKKYDILNYMHWMHWEDQCGYRKMLFIIT